MFYKLLSYFLLRRMSLAMYAAPFNNNDYMDKINNDNDTPIGRKKNANNRTQKRYSKDINSEKVNNILQKIHNLPETQEDELSDFNSNTILLPPPVSAGVEQTKLRDNNNDTGNNNGSQNISPYIRPLSTNNNENNYESSVYANANDNSIMNENVSDYARFMPDYSKLYPKNNSESFIMNQPKDKNDVLIEKLNYMITLLEQQQDEKTNNVTEEVILYSFLGIFIIFIVDSFARVGKYVR